MLKNGYGNHIRLGPPGNRCRKRLNTPELCLLEKMSRAKQVEQKEGGGKGEREVPTATRMVRESCCTRGYSPAVVQLTHCLASSPHCILKGLTAGPIPTVVRHTDMLLPSRKQLLHDIKRL